MGYYTLFQLSARKKDNSAFTQAEREKIVSDLNKAATKWWNADNSIEPMPWDMSFYSYASPDGLELSCAGKDSLKWYNSREDIAAFACEHPDCVFTLYGDGEDSEDVWQSFFCGPERLDDSMVWQYGAAPAEWFKPLNAGIEITA